MDKKIIDDRMIIYLQQDLIAPNVNNFNHSISEYMLDIDELDEVVLNLSSVQNIDSIGVTFVIGLYKSVVRDGLGFAIADASENVRQLFKLMKLEDLLE